MSHRKTPIPQRMRNSALVAIAGLAGCATIMIVIVALFLGLWLDSLLVDRRGPFTICMLVLSIPVSLYVMLRITLGAISMIQARPQNLEPSRTKE